MALLACSGRAAKCLLALASAEEATDALSAAVAWEGPDQSMVDLLLRHGASRGEALRQAIRQGAPGLVASLLETVGIEELNRSDAFGRTVLHVAAGQGESEALGLDLMSLSLIHI